MKNLKPFQDDSSSQSIGGLTIENGTAEIALYGSQTFRRDKESLNAALAIASILDLIIKDLSADTNLPDRIRIETKVETNTPNPWGDSSQN